MTSEQIIAGLESDSSTASTSENKLPAEKTDRIVNSHFLPRSVDRWDYIILETLGGISTCMGPEVHNRDKVFAQTTNRCTAEFVLSILNKVTCLKVS